MNTIITTVFFFAVIARFISVAISGSNERKLKKIGAIEYGKKNSLFLVLAHTLYYVAAVTEGALRGAFFYDAVSYIGAAVFVISIIMLYYVIYSIRHVWTVKLIIAPIEHHTINKSPLFRLVKHPNYYLNIIPELIGYALFFHAWVTLIGGLLLYLIPLVNRIKEEEKIMKSSFTDY